jgi:hypothetical protein
MKVEPANVGECLLVDYGVRQAEDRYSFRLKGL